MTLPPSIPGVFAYLNAILPPEDIEAAKQMDLGRKRVGLSRGIRVKIANSVNQTFRLQWWHCPINNELAKFRLHNRDDMADAIAVAYSMFLRGEDPTQAFLADYAVRGFGILAWADLEEIKKEPDS